MIVLINNWRKKVFRFLVVLLLIVAFAVAVPVLSGLFYQHIPALSGWFQEEHPSGNPMRVEKDPEGTKFEQMVDQFVIKLQDFYYED